MEKESNVIEGKFRVVEGGKGSKPRPLPEGIPEGAIPLDDLPPELLFMLMMAVMSGQGRVGIVPRR